MTQIKTLEQIKNTRYYQDIVNAFNSFITEHGRGPTVAEIDLDDRFPVSARSMQRTFGGLREIRKQLSLDVIDFTTGDSRAKKAKEINERGLMVENKLYALLLKKFGEVNVHRQYMYLHDNRSKADFAIFNRKKDHIDIIDIFYPSNKQSLNTCLRYKRKKYERIKENLINRSYTVWFVCGNTDLVMSENSIGISYQDFLKQFSLQP